MDNAHAALRYKTMVEEATAMLTEAQMDLDRVIADITRLKARKDSLMKHIQKLESHWMKTTKLLEEEMRKSKP